MNLFHLFVLFFNCGIVLSALVVFLAYEQQLLSPGSLVLLTISVLCLLINVASLVAHILSFYRHRIRQGRRFKPKWWKPYPSAHDADTLPLQHQIQTMPLQEVKHNKG